MRSILRERPIWDALLDAFGHSLGELRLSPVTARTAGATLTFLCSR
jgi:hypothetical protein